MVMPREEVTPETSSSDLLKRGKRQRCDLEHFKAKDNKFRGSKRRGYPAGLPLLFIFFLLLDVMYQVNRGGRLVKQPSVRQCYGVLKAPADSLRYYSRWTASTRAPACDLWDSFVVICAVMSHIQSCHVRHAPPTSWWFAAVCW